MKTPQSARRCALRLAATMALVVTSVTTTAVADVVDIAWDAGGRFESNLSIAPGKFAELCGALAKGQSVQWGYEAASPLDFNIHYHQGKDVAYPARANASRSEGTLAVDTAQDYCWMWTNKSAAAVALQVRLHKR